MKRIFFIASFFILFSNYSFGVENQELKDILSKDVKNSSFKPYIEQTSGGLVRFFIFNPSSSNASTETALIKKALDYASSVATPYGQNLMTIKKKSYPKVKNFSVYVLRKTQMEAHALNIIGAASSQMRATTSFPESADDFRVFIFIDDSPFNPNHYEKTSENEFLLETIVNFIHEIYGHAFEIINQPSLASKSSSEQEVRAYGVQLEALNKLKQKHSGIFDAKTQKLLDVYIEDTKAKIEYFKNN